MNCFLSIAAGLSPCANSCAYQTAYTKHAEYYSIEKYIINTKIELVSKRTTREKLLAYLSVEAQKAGKSSFFIPFDRQGLADYLSVDRSAMSAVLSKLRDEGIINFNKNKFELLK